jgi:hemolysin activation/secretion protein
MLYSRYLTGLLISCVSINAYAAAPHRVLEHTGSIYKNIKENTEMKIESKDLSTSNQKKKRKLITNTKYVVVVKGFKVIGNDEFSQKEIETVLAPFVGKKMSTEELSQIANALTEYYHKKGFFDANVALVSPYILQGGIIVLVVDERHLEKGGISVENSGKRIKSEKVQKLWDSIMKPGAMKQDEFERAILLTNDLPGVSAKADLYYGTDENTDDLVITVDDTSLFNGNIDIDNFGSYYTGETEVGTTLYWNSPTGNGEEIVARFISTGKYSNYGYLEIEIPVFDYATRIGASIDYLDYELKHQEQGQGGDGTAWNANLFIKYPLVRTEKTTVELEVRYAHSKLIDNNLTSQIDNTVIDKGVFSISGNRSDDLLENGITYFDFSLTVGNTKLKDQTYRELDALTTETSGSFTKFNYSISRLQNIKGDLSAKLSVDGQWANKNLDTSEKFFIGGPYSMAGYPVGQIGGDDAAVFYADLRYDFYQMPWGGDFQIKAFYSYGWVKVMKDPEKYIAYYTNVDKKYNEMNLQTVGLGLNQTWSDNIVIRAMVGKQVGENEYREMPYNDNEDYDQSDSDYRAWIEAIYYF